jgi:hypothetical protein
MLFEIFESLFEAIHKCAFVYSCFMPPFINVFLKIQMRKPKLFKSKGSLERGSQSF